MKTTRLPAWLIVLLMSIMTFAHANQAEIDEVLKLVEKRLTIMHEVARIKWNQQIPIEDLPREEQLLALLVSKATIDKEWTRAFFQAQFNAAKMIQRNDFALWSEQKKAKFDNTLDLKDDIRPYLDRLSSDLLEKLAKIYQSKAPDNLLYPRPADIDEAVWLVAIAPLNLDSAVRNGQER